MDYADMIESMRNGPFWALTLDDKVVMYDRARDRLLNSCDQFSTADMQRVRLVSGEQLLKDVKS